MRSEGTRSIFVYLNDVYVLFRSNKNMNVVGPLFIAPGLCNTHLNLIRASIFAYHKCSKERFPGVKHGQKSSFNKVNKILEGFEV